MLNSPCYKCFDRVLNCHADCEKYKNYREELDKLNKDKKPDLYACYFAKSVYAKIKRRNTK